MSSRALVLDHIRAERERQIAKHGDHRRDAGTWALILNEETGEAARAALECNRCVERDYQALYEETDSCELTRRIERLTTWAVLVGRVCEGPVCQGKETLFRLDGDVVVDGQHYDKRD